MQPYLNASLDHVICSICTVKIVWSNRYSNSHYVTGTLKRLGRVILLSIMLVYEIILYHQLYLFTKCKHRFHCFPVQIVFFRLLLSSGSVQSYVHPVFIFILYMILKIQSRQSNSKNVDLRRQCCFRYLNVSST